VITRVKVSVQVPARSISRITFYVIKSVTERRKGQNIYILGGYTIYL